MNKYLIFIFSCCFVIILVFVFNFVPNLESENSSLDKNKSQNEESAEDSRVGNTINLYDLNYALHSKILIDSLTSREKKDVVKSFKETNPNLLTDRGSNLYDAWLYTNIARLLNIEDPPYKEEALRLVHKLHANIGCFLSNTKDKYNSNHEEAYILSTKMALDILNTYDEPIPKTAFKCLKETANNLLDNQMKDYISYGDYLYLIKNVDKKYKDGYYFLDGSKYSEYLIKIKPLLLEGGNSIEKFDTILNINSTFQENKVNVKKNVIKKYMNSIQLSDGSFPIYDKGDADGLTTFLAIKIMKESNIEIPKKKNINKYLDTILKRSIQY